MQPKRHTPSSAFATSIGTPGASVGGLAGRFGNAQTAAGTDGELRTARLLEKYCKPGGPTVLHDLVLPMNAIKANIDHVVISGNEVRILDSKLWQPGFYWTLGGTTRRGMTRVNHADKQTMAMATTSLKKLLSTSTSGDFVLKQPTLIVWPSNSKKRLSLRFFRPVGARSTTGDRFALRHRHFVGTKPANPEIVAALIPLVISVRNQKAMAPVVPRPLVHEPMNTLPSEPEEIFLTPLEETEPDVKPTYHSDDF